MQTYTSLRALHLYRALALGFLCLPAYTQGIISTVAGTGTAGFSGDGGSATSAQLNEPGGVDVDPAGNLYIADFLNNRVRKVTPGGVITTIAGTGTAGFSGDGGNATAAQLSFPSAVEVGTDGYIYIADTSNHRIRRIAPNGIITTLAGIGTGGFSGDGGTAITAELWFPLGVTRDAAGNVYVADTFNNRIRKINPGGIISTVAGNGSETYGGDGGQATSASLRQPSSMVVDTAGNLLIADRLNHRIRKVATNGIITTIAGNGTGGFSADGGSATAAALFYPSDIALDLYGNIFIADQGNNRIRKVTPGGIISTVAGNGTTGSGGDGGSATAAQLNIPVGVAVDGSTFIYVVDSLNYKIRRIKIPGIAAPAVVSGTPTNPTGSPQTFTFTSRDTDGISNLYRIYFLINDTTFISQNTCHGFYDRQSNALYLYNDSLSALSGPLTPGNAGTLQNNQCTINGSTSSVATAGGTDLILNLTFSLSSSYSGLAKGIFLWARDNDNNDTGWVRTGTWGSTTPQQPPTLVSGTPASPNGSPQVFTFIARDANGYADINRLYFQVYSSPTVPANSCHGFYDRATNAFYLYNDAVTAFSGPLTPGSSGTLQNSQCMINGAASTPVSGSGTDLTVTISISLLGSYGMGQQKVFVWVTDSANTGTGWIQTSSWGIPIPPQPPFVVSGIPTSTSGSSQVFTFTVRDPNGYGDISRLYFQVFNSPSVPINSCHGFYDRPSNGFYLYNDPVTALAGPLTPGVAGSLQNSQCVINGATSTPVFGSGTDLTVTLSISLIGSYASAPQKVFLWVTDTANTGSGWVQTSTWNGNTPPQPPTIVSGTPTNPTGSPQIFTFTARDLNGYLDITRIYFQVYSSPTVPINTCHGFYDRPANAIYLYNDAVTALTGPLTPGASGTLQNSQCSINGAISGPGFGAGNDFTINLSISLLGAYGNTQQKVYLWAVDTTGLGTGWIQTGTWGTASPPQPPTLVSVTPGATTAVSQTFTITGRDPNGYPDINRFYFLVNTNTSVPVASCHGFYDRPSNTIYLYNDGLTALVGPVTPGVAGTIQNSQCSINGAASSVSASGNDVVLNLNITRQGSYLGGFKSLYMWITDNANTGTGWLLASNWGF